MGYEKCVAEYVRWRRPAFAKEMAFHRSLPGLGDAVSTAARCVREDGKRHPHQYRIKGLALREAEERLLANGGALRTATDFDVLHGRVERTIGSVHGIGELTVYDVAHRIGAFLRIEPDLVYLHAGAREGAKALGVRGKAVSKAMLPDTFSPLKPAEIEDCLCICKDGMHGHGCGPSSCRGAGSCCSDRVKSEGIC